MYNCHWYRSIWFRLRIGYTHCTHKYRPAIFTTDAQSHYHMLKFNNQFVNYFRGRYTSNMAYHYLYVYICFIVCYIVLYWATSFWALVFASILYNINATRSISTLEIYLSTQYANCFTDSKQWKQKDIFIVIIHKIYFLQVHLPALIAVHPFCPVWLQPDFPEDKCVSIDKHCWQSYDGWNRI